MLITLTGRVTHRLQESAVLEAGGLGYEVFLSPAALSGIKVGESASFWIYEHRREDTLELFGLSGREELYAYRRLVGVSGVGPRTAMHIMALGTVAEIEKIIECGDVGMITRVKGVGKKIAQKIILELRGKLASAAEGGEDAGLEEVVQALVGMGVDRVAAREAAASAARSEETVEGRLKAALRGLWK